MLSEAQILAADVLVNVRFTTSMFSQGAVELLVYGTAVKCEQL